MYGKKEVFPFSKYIEYVVHTCPVNKIKGEFDVYMRTLISYFKNCTKKTEES